MNELFIKMTNLVSESSDDGNRKVGCVIVKDGDTMVSYASNSIPNGVKKLNSRKEKPNKYSWIGHAERNAICEAAKQGISTDGCEMYCNYYPCSDCAISIIECGISKLYTEKPDFNHHKWGESWKRSKKMFNEAGVDIEFVIF
jgi:dCMP deaminase